SWLPRVRLDVEADIQDITVLDDVVLPLEPLLPALLRLGPGTCVHEGAPGDHLAADEATRDVGMDLRGRLERGPAGAQRPGAGFGGPDREEGDQPERFGQ